MRTGLWVLAAGFTSLLTAGTALADEDATAAGDGASADPDPAADPAMIEAPSSRYPRAVIDRVLTYPKGMFVVGADVSTLLNPPVGGVLDPGLVRVLGGYGITDDFELNFAHYAFPTDDAGKGSLDGGLGFKLLRGAAGGKLEVIARAQVGYSLAAEQLNPLGLGIHAQYNLTPKLAVITPGGQLGIALAGDVKPITFNLPVSLGFQATPTLYVQLDTSLGSIKIKDSENVFFGADTTPVFVGGYLNVMPAVDVFAGVGTDLTPPDPIGAGDLLYATVGLRYYGGM